MPANINGGTTNYQNGVTNVGTLNNGATTTLQTYVAPDPSRVHQWFDDFDDYVAGNWTITETGSGTRAVGNADGGILVITNAAADNDRNFLQWSGATNAATVETWTWEATQAMWFKARFKVSDATETDFVMGLQITDTTPLDAADGLFFQKDDGSTSLYFTAIKTGVGSSVVTSLATIVSDTYFTVGFWWDPTLGVLNLYYNGQAVGSISSTTNFPTRTLTLSFGIQNGEAVAKSMSLDYLFCSKDRHTNQA